MQSRYKVDADQLLKKCKMVEKRLHWLQTRCKKDAKWIQIGFKDYHFVRFSARKNYNLVFFPDASMHFVR